MMDRTITNLLAYIGMVACIIALIIHLRKNEEDMTNPKINIDDIILIFNCTYCGKLNSIKGDKLRKDIYHLSDYGRNFTGETLILLICEECSEASELYL